MRRLVEKSHYEGTRLDIACLNVTWSQAAVEAIAANLAEIGLDVSVTLMDLGTFWTLGFADSPTVMTNQLILNSYGSTPDPSFATEWFTPAQIGIWNWERFNSPEFEELNNEGLRETDPAKRQAIYVRMQDLIEESGDYLFLTRGVNAFIYNYAKISPALSPDGHTQLLRSFKPV